jgi:hypothetical protein
LKDLTRKETGPRGPKPPLEPQPPPPDFLEWLDLPARPDWKLGWWWETRDFPKIAVEAAKKSYGVKEPAMAFDVSQRQADEGDWLLQFRLGAERFESTESLRPPKRLLNLIARNMRTDLAARGSA